MDIIDQFKNLFDPGTALGAFLISLLSGIAVSFFGGYKFGKKVKKKNTIDIGGEADGDIFQDVHKPIHGNTKELIQETKTNRIHAKSVEGTISQDCEK